MGPTITCSDTCTFKVQVSAFGVAVTLSIVLQTAADRQLFDVTGDAVSDVAIFTRTPFLALFEAHVKPVQHRRESRFTCCSHRSRHGAGGVFVAASVVSKGTRVDGLTGEAVSSVTFGTDATNPFSFLRTRGTFSTTSVPDLTHVHHCRDGDNKSEL